MVKSFKRRSTRLTVLAAGAAAVVLLIAIPSAAQAQAICDQYPNLPICDGDVGPGGGADSDDDPGGLGPGGGGGEGGPSASDAGAGNGELPFTGYPLTPLLLLLLALIAAGLLVRTYLAVRDRVGARRSGTPSG